MQSQPTADGNNTEDSCSGWSASGAMKWMHLIDEHAWYDSVREEGNYDGKFLLRWDENKEIQESAALRLLDRAEKAHAKKLQGEVPPAGAGVEIEQCA
jgi:hypothetical protein